MTYAIVYASKTGNTRLLAETIRESLPQDSCLWCGGPDERALAALKAALFHPHPFCRPSPQRKNFQITLDLVKQPRCT